MGKTLFTILVLVIFLINVSAQDIQGLNKGSKIEATCNTPADCKCFGDLPPQCLNHFCLCKPFPPPSVKLPLPPRECTENKDCYPLCLKSKKESIRCFWDNAFVHFKLTGDVR